MAIKFAFDNKGGFVVGDTDNGFTSYAYPTSPHATKAKAFPARIAAKMMKEQAWRAGREALPYEAEYDARNWTKINTLKAA